MNADVPRLMPENPPAREQESRVPLRRLDDRLVPGMQRASRRTAKGLAAPAFAAHRVEQALLDGRPYRFAWRRRALIRTVTVALALAGSIVHLQRYPDLVQSREAVRAAAQQQTISRPDLGARAQLPAGAALVGPPLDGDPADYVQERSRLLDALAPGQHTAVISLSRYASAAQVLAVLPADVVILRAQYRMPDVRATPLETEVVDSDLARSVARIIDDEAALLSEEQSAQQALLDTGTIESEEFERDVRNRIDEIRTIRNVLASTGGIVFAVVVQLDAVVLRELAGNVAVRLVDVIDGGADVSRWVLFGLKPDDVNRVTFGVPARG
ncbi:MAG: hypothetical protein ACI867_000394 [Glaciecola sp.]|jgi:hypothetical protein